MPVNNEIISQVEAIYEWLGKQLASNRRAAGVCEVCGKCCHFEAYGHKLFVTSPEMLYFAEKTGDKNIKQMTGGQCPYLIEGKCAVYPERFAGCRIFCCKGNADFQSELTETVIRKFKLLCDEFRIPYRYLELPEALKKFAS